MLQLKIEGREYWSEKLEEFVTIESQTLTLEHSLRSISEWESKWHESFLSSLEKMNYAMLLDYVRMMQVGEKVDDRVFLCMTRSHMKKILEYINEPMTATKFFNSRPNTRGGRPKKITSEQIYSWMVSLGIPFECENWHLNRLLTLIHACDLAQNPGPKMKKKDILKQNAALNAQRRAKMGTRG